MVESDDPVGHEDMVSGESIAGDNALGIKSGKRCFPQEHTGQDRTCAISEEDTIRQSPAPHRVLFYAGLQRIQDRTRSQLTGGNETYRPDRSYGC